MGEALYDTLLTREEGVMAIVAINDDMFTEDVIADPYAYYGRLIRRPRPLEREVCPVGHHPARRRGVDDPAS
jgi:hypothetical protein